MGGLTGGLEKTNSLIIMCLGEKRGSLGRMIKILNSQLGYLLTQHSTLNIKHSTLNTKHLTLCLSLPVTDVTDRYITFA